MSHLRHGHARRCVVLLVAGLLCGNAAFAQSLNWEGQTGALLTPFAYTAEPRPSVSFHFLNAGEVVGNDFQASFTVGLLKRIEVGYTLSLAAEGNTAGLSLLFNEGFNTFHGKVNVVRESTGVPAISGGFVARTHVRRVGGVLGDRDTENGDAYVVATKTITQIPNLPVLVNFGVKYTNAALMGIAGNAQEAEAVTFGGVGVVLAGKVVVGSEWVQQPDHIEDLPGATLPTTVSVFARIIPMGAIPFNLDLALVRGAGKILPGVDLKAQNKFGMGISYRF